MDELDERLRRSLDRLAPTLSIEQVRDRSSSVPSRRPVGLVLGALTLVIVGVGFLVQANAGGRHQQLDATAGTIDVSDPEDETPDPGARAVEAEAGTPSPPVYLTPEEFVGECEASAGRPTADEWEVIGDDVEELLATIGEETARTGFNRVKAMSLSGTSWYCGWVPNRPLPLIADDERFYRADLGASVVLSGPSADAEPLGYSFGPAAFVTAEELADPTFDVQRLMLERFGCEVNLLDQECLQTADDWDRTHRGSAPTGSSDD